MSETRFTATSGNSCSYRIERNGNKIAAPCRWQSRPDDNDQAEYRSFIIGQITEPGGLAPRVTTAFHGKVSQGGLERQASAVKEFFEDPKGKPQ